MQTDLNIKTGSNEVVVTTANSFTYIEIAPGVFAYKNTATTIDSRTDKPEIKVTQGVTKQDGITALRKGQSPSRLGMVFIASDELLEEIRRFGYWGVPSRNFEVCRGVGFYDWAVSGGNVRNIIRLDNSNHTFWNMDGTIIPSGIHFDYMSGGITNASYDLEKVVRILSGRDDISAFDGTRIPSGSSLTGYVVEKLVILPIPYYNAERGRDQHISFTWSPSQEQMEAIFSMGMVDRYQTIFEQDMLGLIEGGASRFPGEFFREAETERHDCDCGG